MVPLDEVCFAVAGTDASFPGGTLIGYPAAYNRGVQRALATTVYNRGGCSNFYLDEHGTNFVSWPWSRRRLARRLAEFDLGDYDAEPIEGRR